jgi:hypothetical protein
MTDAGNEQHLAKLLKSFNRNLYLSYASKTEKIISVCSGDLKYSSPSVIKTPDAGGNLAFRISFNYPLYITLSHPICRFRSHRNYPIREGLFIANLGLVPVFFSSLNIMTVLKLWGDRAETFFNPVNSPLADTQVKCWELPESSKSPDYSSMNFILQNLSEPEEADVLITEIYEKYFRLGFWAFPKKGFSPSTHFLHGRTRISSQVKISKSLYVVEEIGRHRRFEMEGKMIEAVEVILRGLTENNGEYFFAHFPAMIDLEIAEKMLSNDNLKTSFINGIVAEITATAGRISLMTVVADTGESYYDILSSLIGIIADKKYSSGDSITYVGKVDDLRESVFDLYLNIYRKLNVSRTMSETISNSFDVALNSMFPILVVEDQKVMMIHPLTWGFLKKWNLISANHKEQKEILLHLVNMMELSMTESFSKLFLNDDAEFFSKKGINKFNFVKAVNHLVNDIRLCKMMRKVLES